MVWDINALGHPDTAMRLLVRLSESTAMSCVTSDQLPFQTFCATLHLSEYEHTFEPSQSPTLEPTRNPNFEPTAEPSNSPTPKTADPTPAPTYKPFTTETWGAVIVRASGLTPTSMTY